MKQSKQAGEKVLIGWTEFVDFPEWQIAGLKAKIDTGARTSALHVEDIEELGQGRVRFHVMIGRRKPLRRKRVTARVIKTASVRSSNGSNEERYYVRTTVRMGGLEKEIELSLVSRDKMLFRMLLGRKALEHDFIVDVSHRNRMASRPKRTTAAPRPEGRTKTPRGAKTASTRNA